MTATSAGVVVPAIIACLVICALILFTCKYCYNPQFLLRQRNPDDIEGSSGSEKPPSRGGFSEVVCKEYIYKRKLKQLSCLSFLFFSFLFFFFFFF